MSSSRPRRAVPSALNSAVIAHVTGIKPVDQARAEAILTKFITTSEAIATSGDEEQIAFSAIGMSNNSGNNPVLGQLKRVQRDLRGLPPLLAELDTFKRPAEEAVEEQEPKNKKIKFSEDEADETNDNISVDGLEKATEENEESSEEKEELATEPQVQEQDTSDEEEKLEKKRQKKLAKKEKKEKKEKKLKD